MAVVTRGINSVPADIAYKFEFSLQDFNQWECGQVRLSPPFYADGTGLTGHIWQLQMTKGAWDKPSNCDPEFFVECFLHRIRSNAKNEIRAARICHLSGGQILKSSPTSLFSLHRDKSGRCDFAISGNSDDKIVVEVFSNSLQGIEVPNRLAGPSQSSTVVILSPESRSKTQLSWMERMRTAFNTVLGRMIGVPKAKRIVCPTESV